MLKFILFTDIVSCSTMSTLVKEYLGHLIGAYTKNTLISSEIIYSHVLLVIDQQLLNIKIIYIYLNVC